MSTSRVCFPIGETVGPGGPSLCGDLMGEVMWSLWSPSPYLYNVVLLSCCYVGQVLQHQLWVLGLPQWCPMYGELLVSLLVRGIKVRNDLCHHFDGISISLELPLIISVFPRIWSIILISKESFLCVIGFICCFSVFIYFCSDSYYFCLLWV